MVDGLFERVLRSAGVPDLIDVLAERLEPSDVQSILLEVYRRRAQHVTPARLLEQYEANRFVMPSLIDPRKLVDFERLAWALLPAGYLPIELAPLCPFGTNVAVASVNQNKVVSTIRNTEVVADTTNVLALEAAVRRRKLRRGNEQRRVPVLLGASQRVTRAQVFTGSRSFAHFRIFALCAAGRDAGSFEFESARLLEHLRYYLDLLSRLGFSRSRVAVTEMANGARTKTIKDRVFAPLSDGSPGPICHLDPTRTSGRGYYHDVCFKIYATDRNDEEIEIGDGGMVDWTQKLLSDKKERLLISALGVERLCMASPATP